jgi:phosphoglycolate phosphatase
MKQMPAHAPHLSSLAYRPARAHEAFIMPDSFASLQAIFFDLDGTLINSLSDIAESINRMLDARGWPRRDPTLFNQFVGDGVRRLVERALPDTMRDDATVAARIEEYEAHYQTLWHDQTGPYPGIVEALAALRARGLKLGVISNKPHRFTVLCCDHFFGPDVFDGVLGQRPEVPRKPDSAGALELAARLDVAIGRCAYVGDSGVDMQFGVNSGMRRIGVRWGFRSEQELRDNGAEVMVSSPSEILQLLEGGSKE